MELRMGIRFRSTDGVLNISNKEMEINMTSKERSHLKGLAMNINPVFQIGKSSVTPEITTAIDEALEARELIKLHVLKNCFDDPRAIAEMLAERTHSEVVQVIGKKIVLYRKSKDKKQRGSDRVENRHNGRNV